MTPEVKEAYSILLTEKGRVLLDYWRQKFGFTDRTTLVANDPLTTAFNEGQRVVWQFIIRDVERSLVTEEKPKEAVTNE